MNKPCDIICMWQKACPHGDAKWYHKLTFILMPMWSFALLYLLIRTGMKYG